MDPARNSLVSLSLQRTVALTLRFVFGLVFVYSGAAKYLAVAEFKAALTSLSILPPLLIPYVAIAIPALEIYLGAAIALGLKTVFHCKLNLLMLAVFTAVMAVEIASGAEASCGCFGNITDGRIGPITLVRNVGLLIWGIFLAS